MTTDKSQLSWTKKFKINTMLRAFGLFKVPMILYVAPKIRELDTERCVLQVPLKWRTKNHLNCMYLGALVIGAECAGGLMALQVAHEMHQDVQPIFKDMSVNFFKRAEGDVVFTCLDGKAIRSMVEKCIAGGERENLAVTVVATVPSKLGDEAVAEFRLTLSVKPRQKK